MYSKKYWAIEERTKFYWSWGTWKGDELGDMRHDIY